MIEKEINLEGAFNFRDIGGYRTADGKRIKKGLLFRSDELSKLTENDAKIVSNLGVKTIIDYRNEKEREQNEDVEIPGVSIHYLTPIADIAALASSDTKEQANLFEKKITADLARFLMIEQNKAFVEDETSQKVYRKMFDLLLEKDSGGIVQHCRGGKDRTGYGIALIMGVLGVSREEIMKDYLLTNDYKKEKNEKSLKAIWNETQDEDFVQAMKYLKEADPVFLNTALDLIDEKYGDIPTYVREVLGVSEDEIKELKDKYLE